jgi:predicted ATPase
VGTLYSHGGTFLHERSHGEIFMQLIENRFWHNGLYFLDEPESALSPLKQMRLLVLMHSLVQNASQFIIATHSPILLAYPQATIYNFDDNMNEISYEDSEHYKQYKLFLDNPKKMIHKLLNDEEDKQDAE